MERHRRLNRSLAQADPAHGAAVGADQRLPPRRAVAAAVQNILLGATAAGLASFWATPPLNDSPKVLELCGFAPDDRMVGVIYLGWPLRAVDTPERPKPTIHHVT